MNYQAEILALRQRRAAELERIRVETKRLIAEAVAARDAEIRRLRRQTPSLSYVSIGLQVGCSYTIVQQVLKPEVREAYNRRRREYWRVRAAQRQAA